MEIELKRPAADGTAAGGQQRRDRKQAQSAGKSGGIRGRGGREKAGGGRRKEKSGWNSG